MRWPRHTVLVLIAVVGSLAESAYWCCAQSPPLIIDGELHDWHAVAPALIDLADAPDSPVDFGEVRIAHTAAHVHLLIDFGRTVNAQGLDGAAIILLDADGDSATGHNEHGMQGVDLTIHLSPRSIERPDRPGMGMGVRSTTYAPDPANPHLPRPTVYDIGLLFAPTHASRRIEFRINRGAALPQTPALFQGESFSIKLVFIDAQGNVADQTDILTYELGAGAQSTALIDDSTDPLARSADTQLRVMNWNVWRGANFTNPDPFARTIKAINPDVILLQEVPETTTHQQLKDFLDRATHSKDWSVALGSGGGDLRCAIASRLPLHETLPSLPMPDQPDRTLRAVGAIIEHGDKTLLAVAVHLRCCGRAGGPEDQQRVLEARLLNHAINELAATSHIDGLVIAGDFNLVGTRDPVEIMAAGLDVDSTTMRIAHPLNLDGLSNVTWADPKQPFAPGRLDYLLVSDASLAIGRSFVYDSRHLADRWLSHHGLKPADSGDASDHRPIVADLQWLHESPAGED